MREKQIEEMAEAIFQNCNCGLFFSEAEKIARFVIEEQGYGKQSEVAKEIFEEIGKLLDNQECITENQRCKEVVDFLLHDYLPRHIAELKKKYIGE